MHRNFWATQRKYLLFHFLYTKRLSVPFFSHFRSTLPLLSSHNRLPSLPLAHRHSSSLPLYFQSRLTPLSLFAAAFFLSTSLSLARKALLAVPLSARISLSASLSFVSLRACHSLLPLWFVVVGFQFGILQLTHTGKTPHGSY